MPNAEIEIRYGRDATVLTRESRRGKADLLVVGSRGRGPYASMLLGSVSAQLVDTAECSVLVARRSTVEHVVVATDGSESAEHAVSAVADWPMFAAADVKVISVGDALSEFGPADHPDSSPADGVHFDHSRVAAEAARRLRDAGRHARATTRVGDASREILALAKRSHSDLIVVGTRGHTGLSRLILGSTAREVLLGTDASVLICR
jgi:nucleotide-binding universal stress UspA family protein